MSTPTNPVNHMSENPNHSNLDNSGLKGKLAFLMAQNSNVQNNQEFVNTPPFTQDYNQNSNQFQPFNLQLSQQQSGQINQNLNLPPIPESQQIQQIPTQPIAQKSDQQTEIANQNPKNPANLQNLKPELPKSESKEPIIAKNEVKIEPKKPSLFVKLLKEIKYRNVFANNKAETAQEILNKIRREAMLKEEIHH